MVMLLQLDLIVYKEWTSKILNIINRKIDVFELSRICIITVMIVY